MWVNWELILVAHFDARALRGRVEGVDTQLPKYGDSGFTVSVKLSLQDSMSDGESSDGEVDFRPSLDIDSLPKVE